MERFSETKTLSHTAPVERWLFSGAYVAKPIKAEKKAVKFPKTLSWEEVNQRFGITEEDLANCEEDEFE